MTRGPIVPWTTRLGSIGESRVKARLAYFSIPTKYEIDPGLDFYCELLDQSHSPTIPFYVQAKGTQHFDERWGQSIPTPTLVYWLRQPAPVFLVVYAEPEDECYWVSIEQIRHQLLERILSADSDSVYLTVDRSHGLGRDPARSAEFVQAVKDDTALVHLARGQARFRGEGYVRQLPHVPRSLSELQQLQESVRAALYSLVMHSGKVGDHQTARLYCEFLAQFDKSHYNHFVWLGQLHVMAGNYVAARSSFRQALDICERDKKWPRESMQKIIDSITDQVDQLPDP